MDNDEFIYEAKLSYYNKLKVGWLYSVGYMGAGLIGYSGYYLIKRGHYPRCGWIGGLFGLGCCYFADRSEIKLVHRLLNISK